MWPSPTAEAYAVAPFHMRLYADVARSGVLNYMNVRRDVPSQLNCNAWDTALADYHDKDLELCQFMRYGWPVSFTASDPPLSTPKNHASALRHPTVISKFINKELEMEAMLGPFEGDPFIPWTKVSPLMTRDKPSGMGKRVIIDLSFPPGRSVNDGVQKHAFQGRPFTYTLPSPLDLAEAILRAGPGASLWKADLERAYRQMRIDPLDYPLLAVRHQGRTYLDVCPSFGCRCSGGAQQRVSNSVVHLMTMAGYKTIAYVDDFCGVASDALTASRSLAEFKTITSRLGLSLAPDKTMTPTTQLEFLGLLFDTVALTITIPQARLQEILDEAGRWTQKTTAQRHEVQSLAGKLNFVSTCVLPARKFMGRILAALRAADERGVVEITPQFKKDLNWFLEYATHCNRRVLIKPKLDQMVIECDACLRGGGGFSSTHYFDVVFTEDCAAKYHISQLEALNVVQALKTLITHGTREICVVVRTDNIAAMYALNTGRTKDEVLAACAREVWMIAALKGLDLIITHVPGADLILADALCRRSISPRLDSLAKTLVTKSNLTRAVPIPVSKLLTPFL